MLLNLKIQREYMILQKDIDDQNLLKNRIDSRPTTRKDTEKEVKDVLHQKQTVL